MASAAGPVTVPASPAAEGNAGLAPLAFVVASSIWGSTFLVIRIGNESLPPLWASTLRLALAAVLLLGIALLIRAPWPRGAALQGALLYGLFNFGLNFAFLYWGETMVKSGVAAVFYATIPLTTMLLASAIGLERLHGLRILGAAVAIGGVAAVFAGELSADAPAEGLLAVLLAATFAAVSGIALKRAPKQAVIPANAIGAAVGTVVCLGGSLLLGENLTVPTTFDAWWPVLYLTLAGSLGAFVLWTWLLKVWSASSASMVAVVVPVLAVALGAVVKGEVLPPAALLGAALVVAGVALVLRAPHAPPGSRGTGVQETS